MSARSGRCGRGRDGPRRLSCSSWTPSRRQVHLTLGHSHFGRTMLQQSRSTVSSTESLSPTNRHAPRDCVRRFAIRLESVSSIVELYAKRGTRRPWGHGIHRRGSKFVPRPRLAPAGAVRSMESCERVAEVDWRNGRHELPADRPNGRYKCKIQLCVPCASAEPRVTNFRIEIFTS